MELNKKYSLNDGKGHIIFSEGNSGTINAEYEIKGNKSKGTFNGTLENNSLKGTFFVDGVAGLMEFTFSEIGFQAKWKKGIEPGPMRGEWKGTLSIDAQITTPVKPQEKVEKAVELPKNEDQPKIIEEKKQVVKNEVKQSKNKYTPLTTTKKWQPFLKEVYSQLYSQYVPDINIYWEDRIYSGLLKWFEFLINEDYLLIQPIEDGNEYLDIFSAIFNDRNKTKSDPALIASRKYYPVLLRQCLSHLLKKEKIKFHWAYFSVIKDSEPEVYKDFVHAFSELSYEEKDLHRYELDPVEILSLSSIYKDFIPLLKAFKNKITYAVDDIAKYPEFDFWKDYTDKYLKNELKFSDYLKSYFYSYSLRDFRIFDAIFNYLKKNKENFSFHLQNYTYVNFTSSSYTDKELLQRHISLLEFLVESGKTELADELYFEKMEFEKKFPN
jgi:hypothetical protein